jgi:hypothetical protein
VRPASSRRTLATLAGTAVAALVACATATTEDVGSGEGDSGGASGASVTGGKSGTTGGASALGGTGATPSGGTNATGGTATGGTATGGTNATGGTATGGTSTGGSSPFGGSAGVGGSSSGGKGGTSGAAATGGTAGAGGAGGAGGGILEPPSGACATNSTLALSYKANQTGDAIGFDLKLTNTGTAPIPANELEFHYYISQEESAWQERVLDVYAIQGSTYSDMKTTGTVSVDALMPALGSQTHVVRIRQTATASLSNATNAYLQLTVRLQPNPSAPNQTQTDDFSYDAAHTLLAAWDHVAVFVNGTLAFGCTPEP